MFNQFKFNLHPKCLTTCNDRLHWHSDWLSQFGGTLSTYIHSSVFVTYWNCFTHKSLESCTPCTLVTSNYCSGCQWKQKQKIIWRKKCLLTKKIVRFFFCGTVAVFIIISMVFILFSFVFLRRFYVQFNCKIFVICRKQVERRLFC